MDEVTVIIPVRNREADRVKTVVTSLRKDGGKYPVMVVDYGSGSLFQGPLKAVCAELGIDYIRAETEGWPWNKSRAINIGVRKAKTPFIVTTDVDMRYANDPIPYCLKNHRSRTMFHLECWWLPQSGDEASANRGGQEHAGGFQFISRSAFEESGGYDEAIQFWGMEDWDWPWRLKAMGYQMVWLPDTFRLYHVWHPIETNALHRPKSAFYETEKRVLQNTFHPRIDQDWGRLVTPSDRPILALRQAGGGGAERLPVGVDQLTGRFFQGLKAKLDAGSRHFILELGKRVEAPVIEGWKRVILQRFLGDWPTKVGFRRDHRLNHNFEYFYSSLALLLDNGLEDYYISPTFEEVELLFRKSSLDQEPAS